MTPHLLGRFARPAGLAFAVLAAIGCDHADTFDCIAAPAAPADPGRRDGPFDEFVFCYTDGTSSIERVPTPLVLAPPTDGATLGMVSSPLSACSSLGPQNIAVLYVTWADPTGQQATPSDVDAAFFGPTPSLDDYWQEVSYGATSATGAVFGPYTLSRAYTCTGPELSALQAAAIAAADPDVDFTQFSRIVIVSPQGPDSGCSIMGVSQIGCSSRTSADGTFTASVSHLLDFYMVPLQRGAMLAAHELGHSLGLGHSNSLDFDLDVVGPVGKAGFGTSTEYGGPYSVMANPISQPGHYSAQHKARLGWLDGRYTVVEQSGSYHIAPIEDAAPADVQALKVRRQAGVDEWLWLELRRPHGLYDPGLNPLAFGGALVTLQSSATDTRTFTLDFTPATSAFNDGLLAPDAPFFEPYSGMTISAENADDNGIDITVSYGAPVCTVTAPGVTIAPTTRVTPAAVATTFDVGVTNLDAASCATGTFQFGALRPSGWAATYLPTPLRLAPGANGPTTLTITPAASAVVGTTYSVSARVSRYGVYRDAAASVFVCGAGAAPTVSVTPTTTTVEASFARTFTFSVRNNDCAARAFTPSASTPAGWVWSSTPATQTIAAGQSGAFSIVVVPPLSTPAGAYSAGFSADGVTASATVNATAAKTRVTTSVLGAPFQRLKALTLRSAVSYGAGAVPAGVAVTFILTRPNGSTVSVSATTGADGVATASYTPTQAGAWSAYSYAVYPPPGATASSAVAFTVTN